MNLHSQSGEVPAMPWDQTPSIYEHIRSHIDPEQPGLPAGGETLPDDVSVNEGSKLRWAAGAMDGVMGHHGGQGDNDELVQKAVELVLAFCESPTATTKEALYRHIIEENTLPLIDPIIEKLIGIEQLNHERLYEIAHSFVTEAPDREPVKFGIAILGLFRNPENESLFLTIGRHEEFTLFCAVALANLSDDPELSLWALARNVNGWGRIQVVERLAQTENPEIKSWLLREGFRNSVMYEYLAYTCATAGGLLSALSEDSVDRELLTSAGELLSCLIAGGPAESIDDFDDGALCAELFVRHMKSAAELLEDFVHIHDIMSFLEDDDADWSQRADSGWTTDRRQAIAESCREILSRTEWHDLAHNALESEDEMVFYRGTRVAEALGIDTWSHHWNRLQHQPNDSGRWFDVMRRCDENRIGEVIALAERVIPLSKISTGAADELGLGLEYETHSCLDFVLQDLRRFPGIGDKLIEAGLKSPVVRNRNMAITALANWRDEDWTTEMKATLQTAASVEPVDDVRTDMQKVLAGDPLED